MPLKLFEHVVKTEESAKGDLKKLCEKIGPIFCPKCQYKRFYRLRRERLRCQGCRHDFHIFTGRWLNGPDDEVGLTAAIIGCASRYGRYGYRRILALLRSDGWVANHKRMERIWRQEGLKVPQKQPKQSRLWLTDGSCVRLRPCWPNHVWSYDFVMARTHDGKAFRMLTIIDEYTRECLAIEVARRFDADAVLYRLTELFVSRRPPDYIRSDNGPDFTARAVRE